jgi:3D (Asp-Asp-Asp) domain-containing protein
MDAIELLEKDRRNVEELFEHFNTRIRRIGGAVALGVGLLASGCGSERVDLARREIPAPPDDRAIFTATAYSIEGKTASGANTHKGIVAADPRVLPIGSRIRVSDAGEYSGEYVVKDTGRAIKGRALDIYIADDREVKHFGKRTVKVEVLQHGDGGGPAR